MSGDPSGDPSRWPRRLRIALLGSRGIPARYGGYETFTEELAARLVQRGMEVTVYCRAHYTPRGLTSHAGATLVVLPTVRSKHFDTPVHTLLSCLDASRRGFDVALMVNSANALFLPLLRLAGTPVLLNVDGIEKRRAKWGPLGRGVFALSERLSCFLPNGLVTDAEVIRQHYLRRYGASSTVIPYGVEPRPLPPGETLARLGLTPRGYLLYVSRFEPENNPHRVAEAYRSVPGDIPLVMVGSAPYADAFIRGFTAGADRRILFPGAIYGDGYRELLSHALAYVQATEVGGTHPALVEAMGYGNCVLAHDTPENREVAGETALFFDAHLPETLARQLTAVLRERQASPASLEARRLSMAERARARFSWNRVTDLYLALLQALAAGLPIPR